MLSDLTLFTFTFQIGTQEEATLPKFQCPFYVLLAAGAMLARFAPALNLSAVWFVGTEFGD